MSFCYSFTGCSTPLSIELKRKKVHEVHLQEHTHYFNHNGLENAEF